MGASLINLYKKLLSSIWAIKSILKKKGTILLSRINKRRKKLLQLSTEIDFLYTQMHTFESKEEALIKEFGDRLTYDLKGFIDHSF